MLKVIIPETEGFDENTQEFKVLPSETFQIEHSLVSISKWESKWKKSFLASCDKLTQAELNDYIICMTITQNVKNSTYQRLSSARLEEIKKYINDPQSATWFANQKKNLPGNRDVITSEIIYYWMFSYNIPKECEKWHINRLLTLIQVFGEKNKDPKKNKMSQRDLIARNTALNARRRAALNTKG